MTILFPHRLRFTVLLLAATLLFQSVGWLLAWKGLQFGARFEAQQAIFQKVNTLEENTFHKDFIQKIKVGRKEILLNGHLYDYRILSETSDSVRLALYHDKHEQALLAALGQVFKSGEDSNRPSSTPLALWLSKWLGSAFLLPEKATVVLNPEPLLQRQNFNTLPFLAQFAPSAFVPPPEVSV